MYCKYCGRQIADDSKFCEFCGELVQKAYTSEAEAPAPEPGAETIGDPILKDTGELFVEIPPVMEQAAAPAPAPEPVAEDPAPTRVVEHPVERAAPEVEPAPVQPKKKLSKGALWGIIGGSGALILTVVLILVFALRTPTVKLDVSQYVDFKVSGYDGYGVATCELDTDGLERAALGEYPTGTDSKNRKKQVEYKEKAAILKDAVSLDFEKQENLSVGDKLTAKITVNRSVEEELHIEFSSNLTATYTVTEKDLSGSIEIDVLDEFYELKFDGYSGDATAMIATKERKDDYTFTTHDGTKYTVEPGVESPVGGLILKLYNEEDESTESITLECSLSAQEDLANGTEVKLTLKADAKDQLMEYGLSLTGTEMTAKVEGLSAFVKDIDDIDSATLQGWVDSYGKSLEKYVLAHWYDMVHGGNALASATVTFENLTCTNKLLGYNDTSNTLYLVFTADLNDEAIMMDNDGRPRQHYFAVAIKNLIVDADGKLLTDKLELPTDDGESYFGAYTEYTQLYDETAGKHESVNE